MSAPNEIIHQSTRLRIMSALNALPRREMLEFKRLRAITGATDGNLGAHLTTLEKAGFVRIVKDFVGREAENASRNHGTGTARLREPCRLPARNPGRRRLNKREFGGRKSCTCIDASLDGLPASW